MMKAIAGLIVAIFSLALSGCLPEPDKLKDSTAEALIKAVDAIPRPIPPRMAEEVLGEGGSGDYLLKVDRTQLDKLEDLKKGYDLYLIGTPEEPVAVMVSVNSPVGTYIIPFKGVKELDRPRRMIKLRDRLFVVFSNRSSEGVSTISVE